MTKGKERVIYSNYNLVDMWDDAIESLKENEVTSPTNEQIWDEIAFMDQLNWEDMEHQLRHFIQGSQFILQGTVGRWDGHFECGFVFNSLLELSRAWRDCDYIKIYDINGHFYIECSHHDGANYYEVRELNEKGRKYYDHYCYTNERQFHNRLMTSQYSHLPNYVHRVYGYPKREYEKRNV